METNISTGFNRSLTDDTSMDDDSEKYPLAILMAAISMIFIEATVHIYRKNKNDLEPIYIFELNTLVSIAMYFIWNAYILIEAKFFCSIKNGVTHYLMLNICVGIMMSQLDRFLALYWHAEYRENVTPKLAMVSLTNTTDNFIVLSYY